MKLLSALVSVVLVASLLLLVACSNENTGDSLTGNIVKDVPTKSTPAKTKVTSTPAEAAAETVAAEEDKEVTVVGAEQPRNEEQAYMQEKEEAFLEYKVGKFECKDTDGGINYNVFGTITSSFYPQGKADYCYEVAGKAYVVEGYCLDTQFVEKRQLCGELGACVDGACVQ